MERSTIMIIGRSGNLAMKISNSSLLFVLFIPLFFLRLQQTTERNIHLDKSWNFFPWKYLPLEYYPTFLLLYLFPSPYPPHHSIANFSLHGHSVLMYALILIRDITKFWWKNRDTSSFSRHFPSVFKKTKSEFYPFSGHFFPPRFPLRHYQIFLLLAIPSFLLSFMIKAISSSRSRETITINLLGKYKLGEEKNRPGESKKSSVLSRPSQDRSQSENFFRKKDVQKFPKKKTATFCSERKKQAQQWCPMCYNSCDRKEGCEKTRQTE